MDNIKILYLCDRQNHCKDPCRDECHHTLHPEFSINYKGTIPLFEELEDQNLFEPIYHFSEGTKDYWEIDSEDPVGFCKDANETDD